MDIEHNSREEFYRYPFGAVTCGTKIRFRLSVAEAGIPNAIHLVYTPDGKDEIRVDMPYVFELSDHSI